MQQIETVDCQVSGNHPGKGDRMRYCVTNYRPEDNAGYFNEDAQLEGVRCADCGNNKRPTKSKPVQVCQYRQRGNGCKFLICFECFSAGLLAVEKEKEEVGGTRVGNRNRKPKRIYE